MLPNEKPQPPPPPSSSLPPPNNNRNPPPQPNSNSPLDPATAIEKVASTLVDISKRSMDLSHGLFPFPIPKRQRTYREFFDPKGKAKVADDDDDDDDQKNFEEERETELVAIDLLSNFTGQPLVNNSQEQEQEREPEPEPSPDSELGRGGVINNPTWWDRKRIRRMQEFKERAKSNASHFARFAPDQDGDASSSSVLESKDGTPFSAAIEAIRMQKKKDKGSESSSMITWVSEKKQHQDGGARGGARISVPSLLELSLKTLAANADAIVSLEDVPVPDHLRHRLSHLLCDSRRMSTRFLELLLSGSPKEVRVRDCSWLTEDQFTRCFQACKPENLEDLEVLQLDKCGRCISDYALPATLAKSPRFLPRLTSLSISGACRLTDAGLNMLVSSAPVLRSINLSQCSLLTSVSLDILADSLGLALKELYLDDFQFTDVAQISPALKRLKQLEVLSLAGIQAVSDELIKDYITARGHNMKELVLKDCVNLTDASVKVIAEHCPGLHALDLMNLCNLTDLSIGYLTNNCQELHKLKLCRNPFSDEAIAAFLLINGSPLEELSLNSIKKVGQHTTLSLARHAKNLHTLDLSWCQNLSDNELGLIADSCLSLKFLKLFGCTQVTSDFLDGYSNPKIQIIGLKHTPLFQHIELFEPPQGALRYSSVSVSFDDEIRNQIYRWGLLADGITCDVSSRSRS